MTFTYTVTAADWGRIAPELILAAMALLVMLVDLSLPQQQRGNKNSGPTSYLILPALSLLGLGAALAATIVLFAVGDHQPAFNAMIGSDYGSLYAYLIILSASFLAILLSPAYLKRLDIVLQGEYYALFLLATTGMLLLAAALNFLMVFLGLELLSLALYILCSFVARRKGSQEAGMKYFLLSSFASAFLLYGIALVYGATGNTSFAGVVAFFAHKLSAQPATTTSLHSPSILLMAMALMAVGFAFKVSAVPFQAWTPDVYDGAPAPVTAFMSVGTKAAAMIAFARVFDIALHAVQPDWMPVVWAITILTIVGGNVLAIVQSNLKRMLAYSSIAHAGYLLIGVVVGGVVGITGILFYLLCYTFMNLGAFGIVSLLERADNSGSSYNELRGLWYRRPIVAGLLAFFLFALAGFPPMAGFAAKYYLFYAALQGGHPELLLIGVLASVLGMYYYLWVISTMFMQGEPALAPSAPSPIAAPVSARRVPAKLSSADQMAAPAPRGKSAATATMAQPKSAAPQLRTPAEPEREPLTSLQWLEWSAIGIAALGTLLMGTLLPFWLVNLAQQAATMMLR